MTNQRREVDRLIEDGLIRYGGGDLAGALAAWERALIQEPGNLQAIGYVDYVHRVFEELGRPTGDELAAPFGLGPGDAPDYQIEILPEPPDDDVVERAGALQDGWLIADDDERDTIEKLYSLTEPPGTLDLEEDLVVAGVRTASGVDLDDTTDLSDSSRLATSRGEAEDGARSAVEDASAGLGFGEGAEVTPGFSDASNSTDLRRPELGFVQARRTSRPRPAVSGAESRPPIELTPPAAVAAPPSSPPAAKPVTRPPRTTTLPVGPKVVTVPPRSVRGTAPAEPPPPEAAGSETGVRPPPAAVSAEPATARTQSTTGLRGATPRTPEPPAWPDAGSADDGLDYANLTTAPFIEELPAHEDLAAHRPARPEPAMTRNLGLAGRFQTREESKFGEESPTRELPRHATEDEEPTTAWGAALRDDDGDTLEGLAREILPRLDQDAIPGETHDDRLRRRISTLIEFGLEFSRTGDSRRAVVAVDLALSEEPDCALAQKLVHRNREAIMTIFQTYLGALDRRPALARTLDDLGAAPIGARAAFLLSRVDGQLTYDEILDVSGMPRLEAYRYLCQLRLRGVLAND